MTAEFPHYLPGQPLDWSALLDRYDWLREMRDVPQDPEWHAEGDVFTHTRMVVTALTASREFATLSPHEQRILVAAALLHDVEKRSCTVAVELEGRSRITAPKHARKGMYTTRKFLYQTDAFSFADREAVCQLVRLHGVPLWALDKLDATREVIRLGTRVNTRWLALLAEADVRGRICPDADELLFRVDLFRELCREAGCYGQSRSFPSDYGRYLYLNREDTYVDYAPFDDLRCRVTLLCGLPGAGKDHYLRHRAAHLPVVSLDDWRRKLGAKPTDKKMTGRIVQLAQEQARQYLREGRDFALNATNITREVRGKWIRLVREYRAGVDVVYLEVPYKELLRRNENREYPVPKTVIDRMIGKLEVPTVSEGITLRYLAAST